MSSREGRHQRSRHEADSGILRPRDEHIALFAILVREYGEAIAFYTDKLGFEPAEDTDLGGGRRWVRVRPPGGASVEILLARAVDDAQRRRVGDQTGGRVFVFWRRMTCNAITRR